MKKIKLEAMSNYHASNSQHGADSENGDMNSSVGKLYVHRNFCDLVGTKLLPFQEQNRQVPIQEAGLFRLENSGYFGGAICPSNNKHSE